MFIEKSHYIDATQDLNQILERYEERGYSDTLSQNILQWGKEAVKTAQLADFTMRELREKILVNPLNGLPYVKPMLEGDWALESEQWHDLRNCFEKSPLDQSNLRTCEPVEHLFAQEIIIWQRKWVVLSGHTTLLIHLPATEAMSVQSSSYALGLTKLNPLDAMKKRFTYMQQCANAVSRRKLQQLQQTAKGVLVRVHEQQKAHEEHALVVIQQATLVANLAEENLRDQLEKAAEEQEGKVAKFTDALETQKALHQKENRSLTGAISALHEVQGQKVESFHQAIVHAEQGLQKVALDQETRMQAAQAEQSVKRAGLQTDYAQAAQELSAARTERSDASDATLNAKLQIIDTQAELGFLNEIAAIKDETYGYQQRHIASLKATLGI